MKMLFLGLSLFLSTPGEAKEFGLLDRVTSCLQYFWPISKSYSPERKIQWLKNEFSLTIHQEDSLADIYTGNDGPMRFLAALSYRHHRRNFDDLAEKIVAANQILVQRRQTYPLKAMDRKFYGEHLNLALYRSQQNRMSGKIRYLTPAELEKYKVKYSEEGLFLDDQNRPLNSRNSLFVMNEYGDLFVADFPHLSTDSDKGFNHSSFLSGLPVAGCGEIGFLNGVLMAITDGCGHYRPRPFMLDNVLSAIKKRNGKINANLIKIIKGIR